MLLSLRGIYGRTAVQLTRLLKAVGSLPQELKETYIVYCERRVERLHAAQRRAIAKAFNDRYTFWQRWVEDQPQIGYGTFGIPCRGGFAWMCPECNKIHLATEISCWTGVQFPKCCHTPAGHRLNENIYCPPSFTPNYKTKWYGPTIPIV